MSKVKKIVMISVAVVLMMVAMLISIVSMPKVGKGNGKNAEVKDLKALNRAVNSLSGAMSMFSNKSGSYSLSASDASSQSESSTYKSFTLIEDTECYGDISSRNTSSSSNSSEQTSFSVSRRLKMYKSSSAIMYESVARMTVKEHSNNSNKGIENDSKISMDMKVCLYSDSERVLMNIEKCEYTYYYSHKDRNNSDNDKEEYDSNSQMGKAYSVLKRYCNKWIDCSSSADFTRTFTSVGNYNSLAISQISDLLRRAINSEGTEDAVFKKSDGVYTLKNTELKKLFNISDSDEFKGTFEIDLNKKTQPAINYTLSLNKKETSSGSGYTFVSDSFVFDNINNTIVELGDVSTVDFDEVNEAVMEQYEND